MEIPGSGDQYNLRWNNHLANFIQTFIEHQSGESLVDVTLSCEGQYIKAHKLILSACSDYFHSLFEVHKLVPHPVILLNGARFVDLKYILHFMYHGEVKVLDKDLPTVLSLGENLQIKGLSSVKLRDIPADPLPQPPDNKPKKVYRRATIPINPKIDPTPVPPLVISDAPYCPPGRLKSSTTNNRTNSVGDSVGFANKKRIMVPVGSMSAPKPVATVSDEPHKKLVLSESPPIVPTPNLEVPPPPPPPPTNSADTVKEVKNAIPKPPHAFMIFANEWRKKLTVEHPEENNKEISVRLGTMWKNLMAETKNIYYKAAERAEEEHKLKYPDYVNSNDSGKRKADFLNDSPAMATNDSMEVGEPQEEVPVTGTT